MGFNGKKRVPLYIKVRRSFIRKKKVPRVPPWIQKCKDGHTSNATMDMHPSFL
jgi:hypothetical protein